MKKQILIYLIPLTFFASMNAQIYTPNGVIQGTSGNNNLGIGTNSPNYSLSFGTNVVGATLAMFENVGGRNMTGLRYNVQNTGLELIANNTVGLYIGNLGKVGIGTTSPSYQLSFGKNDGATLAMYENEHGVNMTGLRYNVGKIGLELIANNTVGLYIGNLGKVGIGTTSPNYQLSFGKNDGATLAMYENELGVNMTGLRYNVEKIGLELIANNTVGLYIANGGNVGVGTLIPDKELTVNGTIHAKEVLVDNLGPLADFVFKPTYKLMSLYEVEQYVNANRHLPEIPSASEVEKKGLNLGEMQNKLLQKVEELTLYIIEQQKKIDHLEKIVGVVNR